MAFPPRDDDPEDEGPPEVIPYEAIEDVLVSNGIRMQWDDPDMPANGAVHEGEGETPYTREVTIFWEHRDQTEPLRSEPGPRWRSQSSRNDYRYATANVYEWLGRNKLSSTPDFKYAYPQTTWVRAIEGETMPERRERMAREKAQYEERKREREQRDLERRDELQRQRETRRRMEEERRRREGQK